MNMPSAEFSHANSGSSADMMGADILVNALAAEGVEFVWGYPGGAVLYIYDAFYKQNKIEHILVRHEQAAVHAADGYARATGKVGVALVTSGPGVTNAVTGIATAYLDSIPMVIITGNVPTHAIGQDAFQECDTVGITRPIVKHNFLVKDVRNLASTIKKAFYIAATGRPGPVVVGGTLYVNSGYGMFGEMAGNVLLAFSVDGKLAVLAADRDDLVTLMARGALIALVVFAIFDVAEALFWIGRAQAGAADPNNPPAHDQALKTAVDPFRRAADRARDAALLRATCSCRRPAYCGYRDRH